MTPPAEKRPRGGFRRPPAPDTWVPCPTCLGHGRVASGTGRRPAEDDARCVACDGLGEVPTSEGRR